ELLANLVASVEKKQGDGQRTNEVHQRRSDGSSANPAHVLTEQAAGGFGKFSDFEIFHAEGFNDAVAAGGFLQDLCYVAKAEMRVFSGAANLTAKFVDRQNDQGEQNTSRECHLPVDNEENGDEDEKSETLLEKVDEKFAKSRTSAIDVVDHDGQEAAGRMV